MKRFGLEFHTVLFGSILAGVFIGTLQHCVSFGIWGDGFGKESFQLACFEGGLLGGVFSIPVGMIVFYVVLKRTVTYRRVAVIVLGSFVGGTLAGVVIFWPSAFVTPILTILLSLIVRVASRPSPKSSTAR